MVKKIQFHLILYGVILLSKKVLLVFMCLCYYIWVFHLRFQHAPQQQQLINDGRGNDPRCGCGKARNSEEMGSEYLQGI